jgi:hypothetical protein
MYGQKSSEFREAHLRAETEASLQTTPRNAVEKAKTASRALKNIRIRNLRAFEMDFRQKLNSGLCGIVKPSSRSVF